MSDPDMTRKSNVEDALYQLDRLTSDAALAAWARRWGRGPCAALINRVDGNLSTVNRNGGAHAYTLNSDGTRK